MRYCIDVSSVSYGTGVSRYTSNLTKALRKLIKSPDTLEIFGTSLRQLGDIQKYTSDVKPDKKFLYPFPPKLSSYLFNQTRMPIDGFIGNADVFHSWDWYLPNTRKTRLVTTVHDLALFKFPEIAHPEIKAHHQLVIKRIKKLKPQIITPSLATKNDLIELFNIDPNDITVIYEALPEEFINTKSVKPNDFETDKPFFLMVGTLEPRKNYPRQIKAWRKYKKDYNLVIVGKDGWKKINPEAGIIRISKATTEELSYLYSKATLLLYCSLYEGFGLPILEGLHMNVPVITSNCSSMAEIAPEYTWLADPLLVESIQTQIENILKQGQKSVYQENLYSWDKAAKETLDVYNKALITKD